MTATSLRSQLSRASLVQETSSFANMSLPYIYGVFGTVSNFFIMACFLKRKDKLVFRNVLPYSLFSFQASVFVFVVGNIMGSTEQKQRLIDQSTRNCKWLSYMYHISTAYFSWTIASTAFIINCWLRKSLSAIRRVKRAFAFVLPPMLALVYSVDLFSAEIIHFDNSDTSDNSTVVKTFCAIDNKNMLLLRDIIDVLVYVILPLAFMIPNLAKLDRRERMLRHFGIALPLFFVVFHLPVCAVCLAKSLQIKLGYASIELDDAAVESVFLLAQLVHHSFAIVRVGLDVCFSDMSRFLFIKFLYDESFILKANNNNKEDVRLASKNVDCLETSV